MYVYIPARYKTISVSAVNAIIYEHIISPLKVENKNKHKNTCLRQTTKLHNENGYKCYHTHYIVVQKQQPPNHSFCYTDQTGKIRTHY